MWWCRVQTDHVMAADGALLADNRQTDGVAAWRHNFTLVGEQGQGRAAPPAPTLRSRLSRTPFFAQWCNVTRNSACAPPTNMAAEQSRSDDHRLQHYGVDDWLQ